jgi:hypothetical protein
MRERVKLFGCAMGLSIGSSASSLGLGFGLATASAKSFLAAATTARHSFFPE